MRQRRFSLVSAVHQSLVDDGHARGKARRRAVAGGTTRRLNALGTLRDRRLNWFRQRSDALDCPLVDRQAWVLAFMWARGIHQVGAHPVAGQDHVVPFNVWRRVGAQGVAALDIAK